MRPELELIEKIEQYLKGELTSADKIAFEKQIAGDTALQEEVRLQQDIMKGIERTILKQKIQLAGRRFKLQKNFLKWGLGGFGVLIIGVAVFLFYKSQTQSHTAYEGKSLPEYNELGEKLWADADRNISAQTFIIDASKDTVIETKAGIVMAVPANGFLDENGNVADGKIELVVKEALDPATIMNAGLSTRSGNELLESGGMFFIDARKDGKTLKIDPAKGIYTELPATAIQPGMQLFTGKRATDGTVDWVDPRPLERDLLPVDIQTLNFYPPDYLDSLQQWGYDIKNKEFTDSLYYSFARGFFQPDKSDTRLKKQAFGINSDTTVSQIESLYQRDNVHADSSYSEMACGMNPAKIKAIWNEHFQNTILSTREFEERLRYIHLSGDPSIIDLYVNNADKSLWMIDSMAALRLHEGSEMYRQFIAFASRHDGKVKNNTVQFQLLRKYYDNKTRAFTEAIVKTQNEFWNKQAQSDNEASGRRSEHETDSISRVAKNFMEELELNVKEAYRQLGYDTSSKPWRNTSVYRAQVTNTGWSNVDRYVYESTITRSSLNYTDPGTGKKAVINYQPFSIQVEQWNEYDQLYVYLVPDKLSSFMRLTGSGGKYTEKLDDLMTYDLVCIAYKEEQAYYYSQKTIQPKDYTGITLNPIEKDDLIQKLNDAGSQSQALAMQKENAFFQFEAIDKKRQKHNLALQELTDRLIKVIFPCYEIWSLK